jgi:hypothetical protein
LNAAGTGPPRAWVEGTRRKRLEHRLWACRDDPLGFEEDAFAYADDFDECV